MLTSCYMYCWQSAILPLAFGVWMKSTFSEVYVYVQGAILLYFLQAFTTEEELVSYKYNINMLRLLRTHRCLKQLPISYIIAPLHIQPSPPLGCPSLYSADNSHPRSPLWSSLHRPGPCGTRTGLLCCWSRRTPPPGTSTRTSPAGMVRK